MSPCSRGAILRALQLNLARSVYSTCCRQISRTINPRLTSSSHSYISRRPTQTVHRRFSTTHLQLQPTSIADLTDVLPVCCPGCGAFTQTIESSEPGFYSKNRKQTRQLLASRRDAVEREIAELETAAKATLKEEDPSLHSKQQTEPSDWTAPKPILGKL